MQIRGSVIIIIIFLWMQRHYPEQDSDYSSDMTSFSVILKGEPIFIPAVRLVLFHVHRQITFAHSPPLTHTQTCLLSCLHYESFGSSGSLKAMDRTESEV